MGWVTYTCKNGPCITIARAQQQSCMHNTAMISRRVNASENDMCCVGSCNFPLFLIARQLSRVRTVHYHIYFGFLCCITQSREKEGTIIARHTLHSHKHPARPQTASGPSAREATLDQTALQTCWPFVNSPNGIPST